MFVTSLAAPIKHNGQVVGVVGIDFALTAFTDLVSGIKPFETGYGFLASNNGLFVAHPKEELVGKNLKDHAASQEVLTAIRQGVSYALMKKSEATGQTAHVRFVPINIGHAETPWSLAIGVPMTKVMEDARGIMYASILIGVISLLVLMVVVFFIAKSIADPMNRVAAGLNEGADQVASASGQVSSASQSLAEGSSEQAAALEETSSSLEEMSSMTKQNADNASQADNLMKEAKMVIGKANDSMKEMADSMDDISRASGQTSKIIKTIDEIAFQTNLLALNAAVEAARAGEAGAGFAVVADEVKNLAMRSAEAAKNTADLIEGTVKKVADGSELVNKTNEGFAAVADSTGKVAELVAEIAAASNEQARGIEQVNTAVMDMDKVTQQNAANAEESASAAEEMNAQAEQMKGVVGELVAVVGGNDAGTRHGRSDKASAQKKSKSKRLPAIGKRPAAKNEDIYKGAVTPQQVIPMDDGDFKDF
jgi:methyl-accepting chemotaxis protein